MNIHASSLRDALAAEYVLGTLHGVARRRFERLLSAHPALRRAVSEWERRLSRLVVAGRAVTPPPEVWDLLQRRLFSASPRQTWWNSLNLWRGLALAGIVAATVVTTPQWTSPDTEASFAAIRGRQHEVLWAVARDDGGRLHVSNLRTPEIPPEQHCLLWLKTGDSPPIMLGALPDDGGVRTLTLPTNVTTSAQSELWVTMQPIATDPQLPNKPLYQTRWQAL